MRKQEEFVYHSVQKKNSEKFPVEKIEGKMRDIFHAAIFAALLLRVDGFCHASTVILMPFS